MQQRAPSTPPAPGQPTRDGKPTDPPVPPIVGIGASAGGLEALELFLKNIPADCGMAFVVVQHLDPTHKGMLPELLQRITPMPVQQIANSTQVQPNHVYVIPPSKDLSLLHGTLHVLDMTAPRGLPLPIDYFFRALAEDRREAAIGVILSGMGSDGTLGLRAIKECGGLTLVQDPATAKFDAMPRSAINAGLADIVAPAEQLPAKLSLTAGGAFPARVVDLPPEPKARTALEKIVILLRDRTGNDFSRYKENTVYRRIERRMGLHQIRTISEYVRYLRENPQELDLLFKELLIGVTRFFRDPDAWETLKADGFRTLLARHRHGAALRAWVPACSTGEEAYSLAMVFCEALDKFQVRGRFTLQIFATDLDQDAIDKARLGFYPANIAADVTPERLARFFVAEENGYRIGKSIREMVIFAPQNVITDPPFTKLDIVTCRNLLIYFGAELQSKVIPLFYYALKDGGLLMLGSAETVGNGGLFEPVDARARLYRRVDDPVQAVQIDFPTKHYQVHHAMDDQKIVRNPSALQHHADQFLLQNFAPPSVLVTAEGDIVYICGRTGKYLEPAAGKANWNIYAMAREGLRHELLSAVKNVVRQGGKVNLQGLRVEGGKGKTHGVNVTVQMIDKPESLHGMVLIVFIDAEEAAPPVAMPTPSAGAGTDGTLAAELRRSQQEIQSIREQMQTSQEELISMNEELQSTNEELQSTNEELTTSKEEMQSLNEELQTVNAELQSKVDDLSSVNNDMKNLLNSTDIAIVFLDASLNVRRYTTQATQIFKLIPGDVGRPLTDIVNNLLYPEPGATLKDDALEVLRSQKISERQVTTRDKRWFKARIMPYRTVENKNDGVVLTFTDITESKLREEELRRALLSREAAK